MNLVSGKGRGGGSPDDPWTHLQDRISVFVQDDLKVTSSFTLNLGMRWAYTSPLVEKDNRQTNFNLTTGRQILAQDGSIEDRALYKPYHKGFEPRLGAAWRMTDRLVFRGAWSGIVDAALGGWKLGGIFQTRSGLPITVIDGRARSQQGDRGSERPNSVGDPVPGDQSINH